MKITLDKKYADAVRKKIIDECINNERAATPGMWHVSDILFPRYGYFKRVKGHTPTDEEVGFYILGEAGHMIVQKALGVEKSEQRGEYLNVIGTCDFLDKDDLTEIKTSRKWTVPKTPQEHYVEQAGYYCVIFKKKKAHILVVYPTAGRKWDGSQSSTVEIVAWTVEFSPADLKALASDIKNIAKLLDQALKKKSFKDVPLCVSWKCGREWKKEVKTCPFYKLCKPEGRYPEKKLLEALKRDK